MEIKETGKLKGHYYVAVLDNEGNEKARFDGDNTIMNAGIGVVSGLMTSIGEDAFTHLAIGTGTTEPNATDTSMVAETYRAEGTGSQETDAITDDSARLTTSVSITNSGDITEIGMFNSSSTGDMMARTTFSAVSTSDGDTVNLGYDIILS